MNKIKTYKKQNKKSSKKNSKKHKQGGGVFKWKNVRDLDEINVGDYVKGETMTNSQKYGDDYNYTVEGELIYKDNNEFCRCEIRTSDGVITNLCTDVGSSGMNIISKRYTRAFYKLKERELTGKFPSKIQKKATKKRKRSRSRSRSSSSSSRSRSSSSSS
tara:strand:+ start:245 stop:724 length:480 start_codon:yes stop_codon:yes gene_type:complete